MQGRVFIGTSGWNYKGWSNGVFYPPEVKSALWLEYYSQYLNSVEVNNSFYHLPTKQVFEAWRRRSPEHFGFAVKVSRFITHMKKLLDPAEHVGLFLERARGLGAKLEVVLFQLPPFWKYNGPRLAALAEYLSRQKIVPCLRAALEVRNPSWLNEECFGTLRRHNMALAFADWPTLRVVEPMTADFIFIRRHGPAGLYSSDYSEAMLQEDAGRIRAWSKNGRDVYAYYNNDANGFAVRNAQRLSQIVQGPKLRAMS